MTEYASIVKVTNELIDETNTMLDKWESEYPSRGLYDAIVFTVNQVLALNDLLKDTYSVNMLAPDFIDRYQKVTEYDYDAAKDFIA